MKSNREEFFYEDEEEEPLTPDEEAELQELDNVDWGEEFDKEQRMMQYLIETRIREFKRDGMSRETFYTLAKSIELESVKAGLITVRQAVNKVNQRMAVFDAYERR